MSKLFSIIVILLIFTVGNLLAYVHGYKVTVEHMETYESSLKEDKDYSKELYEELLNKYEKLALAVVINNDEFVLDSDIIGFNNNNPANVKGTGWVGQTGSDKHGHAVFEHYSYSLRASAKILIAYQEKHKLLTLNDMMNRYCTANQEKYAKFISNRINIPVDEEFDVKEHLTEILKCIIHFENGSNPYPDYIFEMFNI